jgi:sulfatase maturation enzyme AslB (radical SAM superfamily)
VPLERLQTLWINTGTLCNITCRNCYIESSPENDRLAYITASETVPFLDEAGVLECRQIGFTGGEPFLNPEILQLLRLALERGFEVLVLTNAMLPMQRPHIKTGLGSLRAKYGARLTLRVSVDHYTRALHDEERGRGAFETAVRGVDWLVMGGFNVTIAGRTCWGETEGEEREGYRAMFAERGWPFDAGDTSVLTLFPEMESKTEVPEISLACWGILKKRPDQMMCAHSRMVVKRKEAERPVVLPCTLLPYEPRFEMGATLAAAAAADGGMFERGAVKLCHRHCAKFCVLGGGSCS